MADEKENVDTAKVGEKEHKFWGDKVKGVFKRDKNAGHEHTHAESKPVDEKIHADEKVTETKEKQCWGDKVKGAFKRK